MNSIKEKIINNGWVQGSILENKDISDIPTGLFFVLTQDCDLIKNSFLEVPKVELLRITRLDEAKVNGNFTKGKNPRKLHIKTTIDGVNGFYELIINEHYEISRDQLTAIISHSRIPIEIKDIIIRWWIAKYNRAAFPDEFNRRWSSNKFKDKLENKIKPFKEDIEAIYISLHSHEELSENEKYRMRILIESNSADPNTITKLKELLEWIVSTIPESIIIEDDYRVATADDITKAELKRMQELALGYLSLD